MTWNQLNDVQRVILATATEDATLLWEILAEVVPEPDREKRKRRIPEFADGITALARLGLVSVLLSEEWPPQERLVVPASRLKRILAEASNWEWDERMTNVVEVVATDTGERVYQQQTT